MIPLCCVKSFPLWSFVLGAVGSTQMVPGELRCPSASGSDRGQPHQLLSSASQGCPPAHPTSCLFSGKHFPFNPLMCTGLRASPAKPVQQEDDGPPTQGGEWPVRLRETLLFILLAL